MVESVRELLSRSVTYWLRAISGPVTALLSIVAAVRNWNVRPWLWLAVSGAIYAWAVVKSYDQLRRECDAALDGLRDKTDHRKLADELTELHGLAVHKYINGKQVIDETWINEVNDNWCDKVIRVMQRHGCEKDEINHVNTIAHTEIRARGGAAAFAVLHIRLNRIGDIAKKHGQIAEDLALNARKKLGNG